MASISARPAGGWRVARVLDDVLAPVLTGFLRD